MLSRWSSSSSSNNNNNSEAHGLLYPLLLLYLCASVVSYKPVVIVHGLFDSSGDFRNLLRFINEVGAYHELKVLLSGYLSVLEYFIQAGSGSDCIQ